MSAECCPAHTVGTTAKSSSCGAGDTRGNRARTVNSTPRVRAIHNLNIEQDPREEMNITSTSGWVSGQYLRLIWRVAEVTGEIPNPAAVNLTQFDGDYRKPAFESIEDFRTSANYYVYETLLGWSPHHHHLVVPLD